MDEDRLSSIYYFVDEWGNKPVGEFIGTLTMKEQAKVYAYIRELKKQGSNLRRPMADYLRTVFMNCVRRITEYSISFTYGIPQYWFMR